MAESKVSVSNCSSRTRRSLSLDDPNPESASVVDLDELSESRETLGAAKCRPLTGSTKICVTCGWGFLALGKDFTVGICGLGSCRVVVVRRPGAAGDEVALVRV